ncbi:hypothetical protein CLCR_03281 [Cladophialophora carrionii]|uniref:Forkhead domain protein n=1 Tax=Cladophialophora carrionii TaxID=86049 RepID=A0A1C1CGA5_9EURO|nr:hypothetical protein CLCR_03281 [Cladophialophora carrionii]
MSSQAIATSTRGLPDFTSWPDHSNLHRDNHSDSDREDEVDRQPSHSPVSSRPSWSEMDVQQRSQAVGNLLAALAPISPTSTPTQPQTAPAPAHAQTHPPPLPDLPIEPLDDVEGNPTAGATDGNNQNLDPNIADASLPTLPLDYPDHFLDASTLPPLPYPLPLDALEESLPTSSGMAAPYREESPPSAALQMSSPEKRERRQVEAFAKLEFDDGNYYITTYACELGRDAFAYKAALAREEALKAGHDRGHSSSGRSGRRSGLSQGVPLPGDSQVQGSVVSEAGGFGGVDDGPILKHGKDEDGNPLHSHSSEMSAGSVVRPQEVLYHPPPAPFDYHRTAQRQADAENKKKVRDPEEEKPAPVTDEHLPDANRCPLIPIHATQNEEISEVACHRNISRRHVRIEWSDKKECFQMHILGRNGAFLEGEWLACGQVRKLRDGSKIQVSGVEMTFRLPLEEKEESPSEESGREDVDQSPLPPPRSTSPTSDEQDRSISPPRPAPGKGKTKIILKASVQPTAPPPPPAALPEPLLGPDGLPLPAKRRGPGRPPKDGIMSTRERKEREKAAKLAEAKAANGGMTPPPMRGNKPQKPVMKEEEPATDLKPEKRKYKKRKREGEDGDVMPSIEGGEIEMTAEPEKPPPPKKARSKSPSPDYPPAESLTEEQLARPSEPYARLIYDILLDIHPRALPLKQIYRALKLKFPFFVHRVDSEGWQSSVRHNLNQEWNKLFEKGEKEGKGFAWKAIPGALQPQAERRRATQQASASKPKPMPTPRQTVPQGPPQQLNWQNSTPYPHNGMPPQGHHPPFYSQGPNGSLPPPPNGMPWPAPGSLPPSGSPYPHGKAPPYGQPGQHAQPFYPTQQGPSHGSVGHPANQGPYRPPHTGATPVPSSVIPTSTAASRNMPCTLDGLITIKTFENAMLKTVHPSDLERWQRIFASARNRLLHGHPESMMPGGESAEEATIMKHMQDFIQRFRNPSFVGFSIGTGSPAPNPVTATSKTSTPQPIPSASAVKSTSQNDPSAQAVASPPSPPHSASNAPANEPSKTPVQKPEAAPLAGSDKMGGVEPSTTATSAATDSVA